MPEVSAYQILKVKKSASEYEIKKAFAELVKKYDNENYPEEFSKINKAYKTLLDPAKRAREDIFTFNEAKGEFIFSPDEQAPASETTLIGEINNLFNKFKSSNITEEEKKDLKLKLMQLSYQKVVKKLWREAINYWQKVLEIDSTDLKAKRNLIHSYNALGYAYATHNLLNDAATLWENSLKMNPDDPLIIHNLATLYDILGQQSKAKPFWSETLKRWKEQLNKDPDNEYLKNSIVELHKHFGGKAIETKEPQGSANAIKEYQEILKLKPNDFDARFQIGKAYMEEKKWKEAITELDKLFKEYPDNVEIINSKAWALLNNGNVDDAFNTWKRALKDFKNNTVLQENMLKARYSVGKKLREGGLFNPALVHFKDLLKYKPNDPEVHYEIGCIYLSKGDVRTAIQEFQKTVDIDPRNQHAKKALSDARLKLRR